MSLPSLIEQAVLSRKRYREFDKQADEERKVFNDLKQQIIDACQELGVDSTSVKQLATVTVTKKSHQSVKDWDELAKFIKENDALYLFQKRLNSSACKEIMELEGLEALPGCETFESNDLQIREL
jgi:predicted metal-binding protein